MHSKIGDLAKPAPRIWVSEVLSKPLNLNQLSGLDQSENEGVWQSQTPTFEFIGVYTQTT